MYGCLSKFGSPEDKALEGYSTGLILGTTRFLPHYSINFIGSIKYFSSLTKDSPF